MLLDIFVINVYMQGHKDATGLRNKHFPHVDKLVIVFGKDKTIEKRVEAPADVVENIEVEEALAKVASKAYNGMNIGEDDDGFFNEVDLENV